MSWLRTASTAAALAALTTSPLAAPGEAAGPKIHNPYFDTCQWRVWRDDPTPIPGIQTLIGKEKHEQVVTQTIQPPPPEQRCYPVALGKRAGDRFCIWQPSPKPHPRFAGCWDDVYTSWSGLHGCVRKRWKGGGDNTVEILDQIIRFVDFKVQHTRDLGVNFIHKSTTGMAHTITNDVRKGTAERYERLYFGSTLLCAPAHISFSEDFHARTKDLYLAHVPTLFNSVGSSNSETMAITKMVIAGGYLPPALKARLKREGLYASTMLYLWKAALPYDVPFDHELRQRIAYKSVGDRTAYPEKYGAAGINRGDRCLPFHQYDDVEHMRRMIALARTITTPLPEAMLELGEVTGGTLHYALHKSICVLQEAGQDVAVCVSPAPSYDLDGRPLEFRWTLLYGNRNTRLEPRDGGIVIHVPWDDTLPEGRTAVACIANNGVHDGNPAIVSIFRKKLADLPPSGGGYQDYQYDMTHVNRRPIVAGATDVVVRPGKTVQLELAALDPEGQPVRFYTRAGAPGELDGNVFTWKVPRRCAPGLHRIALIASDGTAGNSYAGRYVHVVVGGGATIARLTVDRAWGPAPLAVKCSAAGSIDAGAAPQFGWDVYQPDTKRKKPAFKDLPNGSKFAHVFTEPGLWAIDLTVKSKKPVTTTQYVWVTANAAPATGARLRVEGNGVWIDAQGGTPTTFDHTHFGRTRPRGAIEREFLLYNMGDGDARLQGSHNVKLSGPGAAQFKVVKHGRPKLAGHASTALRIRYAPKAAGHHTATVTIASAAGDLTFAIAGDAK